MFKNKKKEDILYLVLNICIVLVIGFSLRFLIHKYVKINYFFTIQDFFTYLYLIVLIALCCSFLIRLIYKNYKSPLITLDLRGLTVMLIFATIVYTFKCIYMSDVFYILLFVGFIYLEDLLNMDSLGNSSNNIPSNLNNNLPNNGSNIPNNPNNGSTTHNVMPPQDNDRTNMPNNFVDPFASVRDLLKMQLKIYKPKGIITLVDNNDKTGSKLADSVITNNRPDLYKTRDHGHGIGFPAEACIYEKVRVEGKLYKGYFLPIDLPYDSYTSAKVPQRLLPKREGYTFVV
jgi:multisubunit Na+/H+ antiporter MnhF subunit